MICDERLTDALLQVELTLDGFAADAAARAEMRSPEYGRLWLAIRSALAGGKRVRPRLLLETFMQLRGDSAGDDAEASDEHAVQLAAAVELLHTALLVHDDIIDGDRERRGALNVIGTFEQAARAAGRSHAVTTRWGSTAGILAGDLLLAAAVRMSALPGIDRERAMRIGALFDESLFRAAAGELADVAFASALTLPSADDIRAMMIDKTAHYSLEMPVRAAAVLAGAAPELEAQVGEIGRSLGVLFQMTDDLLGVFGDTRHTGKSTQGDLREGKQTLLVAFARETPAWESAAGSFGDARLDDAGADALRTALEASGARARFEADIAEEHARVHRLIADSALPGGLRRVLARTADRAKDRRS